VKERENEVLNYLRRHGVKDPHGSLITHLKKSNISQLKTSSREKLERFLNYVLEEFKEDKFSVGRLALLRSELIGILGLHGISSIPKEIDGVQVMPDDLSDTLSVSFLKSKCEIYKSILQKYGLDDASQMDSNARINLIKAFVSHHFGDSGKAIIEKKIKELRLTDILRSPQYKRIVLAEYILQSMLLFYVSASKSKILRSELVNIMDIELDLIQGISFDLQDVEKDASKLLARDKRKKSRIQEFDDILKFQLRKELSQSPVDPDKMKPADKNRILKSITCSLMGKMTEEALGYMYDIDEGLKTRYLIKYLRQYLEIQVGKPEPLLKLIASRLDLNDH
jgi:hypothetical protein